MDEDEEEPGTSASRKRVTSTKFNPSKRGRGGRRQNDRAAATIAASEATPPPPLIRQVPAVTRGGYTLYTSYYPTQPQANYLLATGRSETVVPPRSEVKVTVDLHIYLHPASTAPNTKSWSVILPYTTIFMLTLTQKVKGKMLKC